MCSYINIYKLINNNNTFNIYVFNVSFWGIYLSMVTIKRQISSWWRNPFSTRSKLTNQNFFPTSSSLFSIGSVSFVSFHNKILFFLSFFLSWVIFFFFSYEDIRMYCRCRLSYNVSAIAESLNPDTIIIVAMYCDIMVLSLLWSYSHPFPLLMISTCTLDFTSHFKHFPKQIFQKTSSWHFSFNVVHHRTEQHLFFLIINWYFTLLLQSIIQGSCDASKTWDRNILICQQRLQSLKGDVKSAGTNVTVSTEDNMPFMIYVWGQYWIFGYTCFLMAGCLISSSTFLASHSKISEMKIRLNTHRKT